MEALSGAQGADELADWSEVLRGSVSAWQAAYEHGPASRAERALLAVADDPEREPIAEAPAGICGHCGGPIPPGKRPTARFCSPVCQRAQHGRTVAA